MSQREVAIVGKNNTKAAVTGQEELLVKVGSLSATAISEIAGTTAPVMKTAESIRVVNTSGTIAFPVKSISFASVGTATAIYTINGVPANIKPGETVSFDAGDTNNYFKDGVFGYNAPTASAELLIAYTY